jgi:hypothetical protein
MATVDQPSQEELKKIRNDVLTPTTLALLLLTETNDGWLPPEGYHPWDRDQYYRMIEKLVCEGMLDATETSYHITNRGQIHCDNLLQTELPS